MSEQQETSQDAESDSRSLTSSPDAQSTEESAEAGQATGRPAAGGKGNALAWLALLVAVTTSGLVAWQWWLSRAEGDADALAARVEAQASELDEQSRSLGDVGRRVDELATQFEDLSSRVESADFDPEALRGQVRSQADAVEQLRDDFESRTQRLEQALDSMAAQLEQSGAAESARLDESLADARYRMALIEVGSLLRLGQARAELASDPSGALAAYDRAGARLEAIEDSRLERLRRLLSREAQALRSIDVTDWSALAGSLSALESGSASWSMGGGKAASAVDPVESDAGADQGWWASVRQSLGGLVRVSPRESVPLSPAAAESVRERLRLHLAAAQAAVAARRVAELHQQAEAAEGLIRDHFDTSSEAVSQALGTLSEAMSADRPSLPDLGAALAEAERRLGAS